MDLVFYCPIDYGDSFFKEYLMKKITLFFIYIFLQSSVIFANFSDPKILQNVILKQSINQALKKRGCTDLRFEVFTEDKNNIAFELYKISPDASHERASRLIVEIDRANKWLILFSYTSPKHRHKHFNLFLRAAVFKYFHHNADAKGFQVASEVTSPFSAAALKKYFKISKIHTPYYKGATPTFYLKLKENQKNVKEIFKKYPDCP